jgi:predicted DNA-binding transcriptional regulator AlpA
MSEISALLNTAEAAAYLRMAKQTLTKWRCHGRGPQYVRMGSSIFYRLSELDRYIEAGVVTPEAK